MYIIDFIKLILNLSFSKDKSLITTDIASKNTMSIFELSIIMKKIFNNRLKVKVLNNDLSSFSYLPEYSNINCKLSKETNFETALKSTFEYYNKK